MKNKKQLSPLAMLAKKEVESYVEKGKIISIPNDFPKEFLNKKAGVFVTINKNGNLRACIGTFLPTEKNIAKETIANANAAATKDWRFGPIKKEEFPFLKYEVSVLSTPIKIKDFSELDQKKYGVIVQSAEFPFKKGLLLPDIEGINSPKEQILIAAQKGEIDLEKEKIILYKFTVEKYN